MIRVEQAPLQSVAAEAVVCPIRADLAPITSAARDLLAAAGPEVQDRLEKLGSLPVGGAVMTPGGQLDSDFLIHVVVMSADEPQTTLTVQRALRNGLGRAADWGVESLALPPLGLGVGLTEPDAEAEALVEVLWSHLDEGRAPLDLVIVASTSFEEDLFNRMVAAGERERDG